MCQSVDPKAKLFVTRQSTSHLPTSPLSLIPREIEVQRAVISLRIAELDRQLTKNDKLEHAQEKNAKYLQHSNQLLQNKSNDHCCYEHLQVHNVVLKLKLEELQQEHQRL